MTHTRWLKAYQGPFTKKEATQMVEQLQAVANPEVNGIYGVEVRVRENTKEYYVYIKEDKPQ